MALDKKMFTIRYPLTSPPPPPSGLSVVAGNGSVTVIFTPESVNSISVINYQYSTDGVNFTAFSPAVTRSPVTITGLTNGLSYTIYLKAVNVVGPGIASSGVSVTPAGPPFAPSGLSAVAGDGSATVAFAAGSANGRSITNYQYSTDGTTFISLSPTDSSSPVTIPGLTNGTPYMINLKAVNAVGISVASSSVSVTPAGPPFAPSGLSAVAGNGSATVSFTPGSANGSPITNYQYSTDGTTFISLSPADDSSPVTITGLTNGSSYTITLRAVNAVGTSTASSSVSVTLAGAPSAPSGLSAVAGDRSATVSFTPGSANGSPITNYQYSMNESIFTELNPPDTSSPITITGLTNGTPYLIKLKAINAVGLSEASSASNSVTPVSVTVAAPSLVLSLAADKGAYIYFTQIGAVTNYQYTIDGGSTFTVLSPATNLSPVFIPGLNNSTAYTVQLQALDSTGNNSISSNAISVTPTATPQATAATLVFDPNQNTSYSGSGTTLSSIGSVGSLNGTMTNVGYINGPTAGSNVFTFSGSSYVTFPTYNFGTQITLCAWINPEYKKSINGLLTNIGSNQSPNGFKMGWNSWNDDNQCCYFEAGNGSQGSSAKTVDEVVTLDTWQHYGCVFDQANRQVIFFINGVPINISSITTVVNINTNNTFRIGAFMDGFYSMKASLGALKIYNYLFNATDMMNEYTTSKALYGL